MEIQLFAEGDLHAVLEGQRHKAKAEIELQEQNYLLNANETELARHFIEKFRVDPLVIHGDQASVTYGEEMIPQRGFVGGPSYRRQVIYYHIPFSGEAELLKLKPSQRLLWSVPVQLQK